MFNDDIIAETLWMRYDRTKDHKNYIECIEIGLANSVLIMVNRERGL